MGNVAPGEYIIIWLKVLSYYSYKYVGWWWWGWFSHEVMSDSCNPMDCSPPGSSVHEISQTIMLEWVSISFSGGSSRPRDPIYVSCIGRQVLYHWATEKPWTQSRKVLTEETKLIYLLHHWATGTQEAAGAAPGFSSSLINVPTMQQISQGFFLTILLEK